MRRYAIATVLAVAAILGLSPAPPAQAADKYPDIATLLANEPATDYRITRVYRPFTSTVVVSIHGGGIEPGTTQIGDQIARTDLSRFDFSCLQPTNCNADMHVTSTHWLYGPLDSLTHAHYQVVSLHGFTDETLQQRMTYVGGLDTVQRDRVIKQLRAWSFFAEVAPERFGGVDPNNYGTNHGKLWKGVQLEMSRTLRDQLVASPTTMATYTDAVRSALT